jgi:hypothetical protein
MVKKNQISLSMSLLVAALLAACSPLGPGALIPQASPSTVTTATPIPSQAATAVTTAGYGTSAPPTATANPETPAPPAPAAASPTAVSQPADLTVTLAQNNQTITLQPGQRFLLDLGDTMRWTVNVDQQAVVSRVIGITVIKGAQGVYQAGQTGQAVLNAVGLPVCGKGPCSMLALDFSVTITVAAPTSQPTSSSHY